MLLTMIPKRRSKRRQLQADKIPFYLSVVLACQFSCGCGKSSQWRSSSLSSKLLSSMAASSVPRTTFLPRSNSFQVSLLDGTKRNFENLSSLPVLEHVRHAALEATLIRGGETTMTARRQENQAAKTAPRESFIKRTSDRKKDPVDAYYLKQRLLLQTRSIALRQALIDRGIPELAFSASSRASPREVDWKCAISTREHRIKCEVTLVSDEGTKYVAPRDSDKWVSLSHLNRVRRDSDPTKVDKTWNDQYKILDYWFKASSPLSFQRYLTPRAYVLSRIIDILPGIILTAIVGSVIFTLPLWDRLIIRFVTHPVVWKNWKSWYRFLHAGLPLKFFFLQLLFMQLLSGFSALLHVLRSRLVDMECMLLEECVPETLSDADAL